MLGVLQRRIEQSGGDEQERLMLSFDKLFSREKNNPLWELFHFWQNAASKHDGVPRVDEFDYKAKLPESVKRYISWSDVTPVDPFNFVSHDHVNLTNFRNHSNRRLGDYPAPMHARACAIEYLHCIRTRQPTYYEIDQTIGTINRHMVRMMVPVADQSGTVSKLIYAVRIIGASPSSSKDASSEET